MTRPSAEQAQRQIDILFEEYRALRDDVNTRIGAQMTLLGFSGAALALFIGLKHAPGWVYGLVTGAFVLVAGGVWMSNNYWLHRAGSRIGAIETQINALARISLALPPDTVLLDWQRSINTSTGPLHRAQRVLAARAFGRGPAS